MSRPYLSLCRDLVAELGVAGGTGPAATTGQTGELGNMVRWVAEADLYVQNLWRDWSFLWRKASGNYIVAGGNSIASVTDLETEIEDGLVLRSGSAHAYRPQWMAWAEFRRTFDLKPEPASLTPSSWTVRPDKVIVLSGPVTVDTQWTLEYHRAPARLAAATDLSAIPDRFERIIIARAAVMYGVREDAPEIVAGFAAEYADTLEKMEAFYLAGFRDQRRSRKPGATPDILGG